MSALTRHNVRPARASGRHMVFAHGFGCDQTMWRLVAPSFDNDFGVMTFDDVGAGGADKSACDRDRYASLAGYVRDVVPVSSLVVLDATGHCPHLSAPEHVVAAKRGFL